MSVNVARSADVHAEFCIPRRALQAHISKSLNFELPAQSKNAPQVFQLLSFSIAPCAPSGHVKPWIVRIRSQVILFRHTVAFFGASSEDGEQIVSSTIWCHLECLMVSPRIVRAICELDWRSARAYFHKMKHLQKRITRMSFCGLRCKCMNRYTSN